MYVLFCAPASSIQLMPPASAPAPGSGMPWSRLMKNGRKDSRTHHAAAK